ncbi:hypothetical protein LX15_005773 [Streptoalloteichus tenebrarius]|uniref:Uncharacterized protein n=1 Tax=Streptoalloteichus tenebrarius (strain ATCC 17920 / DSM 40477 / JCM 4838 / CBS 697.72 / NBRC 16177 / NCIMB 11028 / NRRL B-12390 / A12253. 1 / ISP 5477) TaxID=1933 RepID=A0ABT1I2N0_STRSD|nr:hypothetical protein [Streptoalloteichus tenebrarius]MCP2262041.1 hypothetical protein [Streptoalloteichus tenebrarius]BFF01319.1 hypothetical protein GCM10020241_29940 [Streptoalloteichus tenebrarius]
MSSIAELRAALEAVREQLRVAHAASSSARESLEESRSLFLDVGRNHPEPLLPPELAKALDQVDHALSLVVAAITSLDGYATRL